MKFNKLLTLILVLSLTFGFYSCSKKEEPQDEQKQEQTKEGEQTTEQNKDESAAGDVSKEDFVKYANAVKDYMQSDAFINEMKALVKEATANADKGGDANQAIQKGMQDKIMAMGKEFGFENETQLNAVAEKFKDDPEIKALEKEMESVVTNAMVKLMTDKELLGMLPENQRKQMEQMADMMKSMQQKQQAEPETK